eukprot:gene38239-47212_t
MRMDGLQQDLSDLRDDAILLQEEVQLKDEQIDALETTIAEIQTSTSETVVHLQLQLAEKDSDLSEAHAIIASSWSQPDYVSTQSEMNALRGALDTQSLYSAELEKSVESLESQLSVVRKDCAMLQQDIQCREEQIRALESNVNQFQQMVCVTLKKRREGQLSPSKAERDSLEQQIQDLAAQTS